MTANSNGTSHIVVKNAVQFPHIGTAYDYYVAGRAKTVFRSGSAGPAVDPEIANLTDIPAATKLTADASGDARRRGSAHAQHCHRVGRKLACPEAGSVRNRRDQSGPFSHARGTITDSGYYGGHVIVRQGVQTFKVQGVEFYQLGQGGLIGRYPVHFHMDRLVPRPSCKSIWNTSRQKYDITCSSTGTYLADSSIVDSMTRFVTVHATQGVTLARNVGYMSIGQGYYLEDATETDNRLYSNVAITMRAGIADALTNPRNVPGILEWDHKKVTQLPTERSTSIPMGARGTGAR